MRPEARFHDGSKLTAHDVAFSLIDAEGERPSDHHAVPARFRSARKRPTTRRWSCASRRSADATCRCSSRRCRFSRSAYYAKRPFEESTLDIPLGSGPYKVGRFEAGRYIEYERVKDWWGAKLPVAHGLHNFDVAALRILSRPRRRVRRLHRQELSVPRGIHLAHLGDALRFPRASRTAASSARS